MLTIDLEQSLIKEKQRSTALDDNEIQKAEKLLESVNATLADADIKDMALLESMGFQLFQVNVAKSIISNRNNKKYSNLDKNRIFTKDEIKSICIKYRLRFLQTKHYQGYLSPELPQKIRDFKKAFPDTYFGSDDSYIAAPKESFILTERPKDPLFFCQLEHNLYYLVHKWGNDLSIFRRLTSFPMQSDKAFGKTFGIILPLIISIGLIFDLNRSWMLLNITATVLTGMIGFLSINFSTYSNKCWDSVFTD